VNNQLAVPQSLAQPSFLFRDAMATFAGQKGAQSGTTISLGQQFKQSPQRPQSSSDLVLAHLSSGGATELSPEFAGWKNIFRGFLAIREDVSAMRLLQPPVLTDAQTRQQFAIATHDGLRPMKRSWTDDEPADHSNTRSSPARKVQRLPEQSLTPHLSSAAEQGPAFAVVESNDAFARDLQAELNGKK